MLRRLRLFVAGCLVAVAATAQVNPNCRPAPREAAAIVFVGPDSTPFAFRLATNATASGSSFVVKDAAGLLLRDVSVTIQLPESPAGLVFSRLDAQGNLVPIATPKRLVIDIREGSCIGYLSAIVTAGSEAGTFTANAFVTGSSRPLEVPVTVLANPGLRRVDHGPAVPMVVAAGQAISPAAHPYASATWGEGAFSGGISGIPITFSAPGSEPTVRFANGMTSITVTTNVHGYANTTVTAGAPGVVDVVVTYPDGSITSRWKYLVVQPAIVAPPHTVEYGNETAFTAVARFVGFPCDYASSASNLLRAWTRLSVGGFDAYTQLDTRSGQCSSEGFVVPVEAPIRALPFGVHQAAIALEEHPFLPRVATSSTVEVLPKRLLQSASGRGTIRLGNADPRFPTSTGRCVMNNAQAVTASELPNRPEGVDFPYGALRLELANCVWRNDTGFEGAPATALAQRVLLQTDEELDPAMVLWAYGPTADNASPHWYELRTTVVGRFAQFEVIDGVRGDDSLAADGLIRPLIALGAPRYSAIPGSFQDLWWAGPMENGWGINITQHRDVLFATFFLYDASEEPRWLVMSGGEWNAQRTAYTGTVYRTRGTPFGINIASNRSVTPVGSARLTFTARDALTLDYTIDGVTRTKQLRRQLFGPPNAIPAPRFDDLWWGGEAESGWGFALAQQYRTLFGVLYTYDASGEPTWFVAPSLAIAQTGRPEASISSNVYRTRASWSVSGDFFVSRLAVTLVGTLSLSFMDGWESARLYATIAGWREFSTTVTRQPF